MKRVKDTISALTALFWMMATCAAAGWTCAIIIAHKGKTTVEQRDALAGQLLKNSEMLRRVNRTVDSLQLVDMFESDEWHRLIEALIMVESRGQADAVGDDGMAVGILQLWPCVVDDLQVAGYDYTLDDRLDPEKSRAMFNDYQRIYNPTRDIERAIQLHNPRAGVGYRNEVIKRMEEIK